MIKSFHALVPSFTVQHKPHWLNDSIFYTKRVAINKMHMANSFGPVSSLVYIIILEQSTRCFYKFSFFQFLCLVLLFGPSHLYIHKKQSLIKSSQHDRCRTFCQFLHFWVYHRSKTTLKLYTWRFRKKTYASDDYFVYIDICISLFKSCWTDYGL